MKAAIYSRKSKFDVKSKSTENQVQMCKDYANNQLKEKNISDFLIYEDEGYSGGSLNRPNFQKLIKDAKLNKFDILICYRLDRISRNVSDFSNTLELLQKYNIDFISINEQFDTSIPMGRAMIYIASVFAQLERETIAERVRDNMMELAKSGRWLGGSTPIGYTSQTVDYIDNNTNKKRIVKLKQIPKESKLVKLIYDKYIQFKSIQKVQTFLIQNDYKTKRGADFSKSSIKIILSNPVYVKSTNEVINYLENEGITVYGKANDKNGLLTYNKQKTILNSNGNITRINKDKNEWIAAISSHEGIIEGKDWLNVQKVLYENKNKFPNQGKTHNALLTNIIRCTKCNSPMQISHGHVSKKTGEKAYYYVCSMKKNSKGTKCNNKNAKVSELDNFVLSKLKGLGINKKCLIDNLILQSKYIKDDNLCINKKEKQIDNLINKLSVNNNEDVDTLIIDKINILKNEIEDLKAEQKNKTKKNTHFIKMILNKNSIIDILNTKEKQQLINELIDSIKWDGENYEMEINFTDDLP